MIPGTDDDRLRADLPPAASLIGPSVPLLDQVVEACHLVLANTRLTGAQALPLRFDAMRSRYVESFRLGDVSRIRALGLSRSKRAGRSASPPRRHND